MEELTATRESEFENVRTAYFLEETVSNLKREEKQLYRDKPERPVEPQKPVLQSVTAKKAPYPPINPNVKFPQTWKKGAYICGVGLIACFLSGLSMFFLYIGFLVMMGGFYYAVFLFIKDFKEKGRLKEQKIEEIRNSSEYRNQCQQIDEENRTKQMELDKEMKERYSQQCLEYEEAMKSYKEQTVLFEKEDLPQWNETMESLQTALHETQNALQDVYDKNIIPSQYRRLPSVLYLAAFLGTSQYDLKYAIERYDSYVMQCARGSRLILQVHS